MSLISDVQKLDLNSLIEFFILDTTVIGGTDTFYFHAGVNGLGNTIVWNGQSYTRWPLSATGFELSGKGVLPKPSITVANIDGSISALCKLYEDLVGAKLWRIKTHGKYLDAVNFPGGVNPTADPAQFYPHEIWKINRKTDQNPIFVNFELAASWDVQGYKLPGRQMIRNQCPWTYRSAECSYTGAAYFDAGDVATDAAHDVCGKRISSCGARFGTYAVLPWGGFPLG